MLQYRLRNLLSPARVRTRRKRTMRTRRRRLRVKITDQRSQQTIISRMMSTLPSLLLSLLRTMKSSGRLANGKLPRNGNCQRVPILLLKKRPVGARGEKRTATRRKKKPKRRLMPKLNLKRLLLKRLLETRR